MAGGLSRRDDACPVAVCGVGTALSPVGAAEVELTRQARHWCGASCTGVR